jgi:hypothetical protein
MFYFFIYTLKLRVCKRKKIDSLILQYCLYLENHGWASRFIRPTENDPKAVREASNHYILGRPFDAEAFFAMSLYSLRRNQSNDNDVRICNLPVFTV